MEQRPVSEQFSARKKIFYGWWIVIACFTIGLYAGAIIFYGFTAFFEPLIAEFGWSYTEVSFAISLRGIEMSFLAPLVGFFVDRYGSRRLAFLGVATIGFGFIALSFTRSLWMFYASFILIAFGGGGCTAVVFMRVVTNWFHKKLGLALGILTSGFGASGFLIPVIVWLIDGFGWRTAVTILGIGMWVIGLPLCLVIRNTPESCGLNPDGLETAPESKIDQEKADSGTGEISFRDALKRKSFIFLALGEGIRMMAVGAVIAHIMPYLNFLQIPRTTAGLAAGSIAVLSIAGRFGFGWLSDHLNRITLLTVSFAMMSLGMFALCYVDIWWMMILFLILFPSGFGGAISVRGVILREYFGLAAFGRLLGIVMGFSAVGGMIGPTLAGFVFDAAGTYYFTWIGFGAASLIGVFLMLSLEPGKSTAGNSRPQLEPPIRKTEL
jgi:MFS family permease